MQMTALGVLLEPVAQPRPLPEQRLVRDLDGAGAHGEQPVLGQHPEGVGGGAIAVGAELRQWNPPADDRAPLVLVGETQEQLACSRLLRGLQLPERVLGEPRHGTEDPAGPLIRRELEPAPTSQLPQLEQRRREQRERPWLAFDVGDHRVLQVGVDAQSHAFGRLGDRATHLVARHRPDDHVVGADEARQPGVRGAAGIEVGPQRQHDHRAPPRVLCAAGAARRRRRRAPARRDRP